VQTKLTGGVIASVVTPFAPNGEVDADRFRSEVMLLDKSPVEGLCVGGLLSGAAGALPEELRSLVIIARKATKKPLFAMLLPDVAVEALDMLRAVTDGGADAVMVAQPHYLCQPGEAGLVEMFEQLRKQAKLPLLLADCFPEAKVGLKTTRHLIDERLVDGVLQAADAHALVDLLCLHPDVPVYCGVEDLHYVALILGAHGSISDLGSVFPTELSELHRAFKGGKHEDARMRHERLARVWRVLSPAAERESRVRSALAAQGREVGVARSPYNFIGADIGSLIKSTIQREGLAG
jgi:dihydrodipicolinate synthase/N-acetylneuraminate lyase